MTETTYAKKTENLNSGFYNVTFLDNETRKELTRSFDSPYQARVFVNKIRHSKNCTLISYPLFE